MINNFQSEKGVSVLLSVMILSVVLSIALGSSDIAIKQSASFEGIGDHVVAFYAADHGIEAMMMEENPTSTSGTLSNGATYKTTVIDSSDPTCDADHYCITSLGSYEGTKRAIQAIY